ncbi:hypothetical protein [Ruicaihuangia caeni]|uniref:Uncharacterized protein n=1 Tax=Ruicaihuangia caeni TaxID=3042517 RepID=A0AAW6T536_9MICO|nr:hypothetical protein [Klugiella sp. YN-L-19]MDI2098945.1 hypothetical protein [Klugiella sp. YN-L-19]
MSNAKNGEERADAESVAEESVAAESVSADSVTAEESADNRSNPLPPAEHWWPKLSVEAKHALLENLHAPLGAVIVQEIALITKRSRDTGIAHLSEEDRRYILTQIEPVD